MGMRASTYKLPGKGTGRSNAYRGIILGGKDGAKHWPAIWECSHLHDNRDNDSAAFVSARTCAEWALHLFITAGADADDVRKNIRGPVNGMHALEDAAPGQLDWLADRSLRIQAGRAGNAGNRRAYPETWVDRPEGKYRGKLWEKTEDSGETTRRLFIVGPMGQEEFFDGYVDLATHEAVARNKDQRKSLIPLGWLSAAKELEWSIPQWAPHSASARGEYPDQPLRPVKQEDDSGDLSVPAVYRVRVNRGATRTYDVVEVQTEEVIERGLTSRVAAYKAAAALNDSTKQVNRRIRSPEEVLADNYLYTGVYWGSDGACDGCNETVGRDQEGVWFADMKEGQSWSGHSGYGPVFCSKQCGIRVINDYAPELAAKRFAKNKDRRRR